jgi:hypothetical protein
MKKVDVSIFGYVRHSLEVEIPEKHEVPEEDQQYYSESEYAAEAAHEKLDEITVGTLDRCDLETDIW